MKQAGNQGKGIDKGGRGRAAHQIRINDMDPVLSYSTYRKTEPFSFFLTGDTGFTAHDGDNDHLRVFCQHLLIAGRAVLLLCQDIDTAAQSDEVMGKGVLRCSEKRAGSDLEKDLWSGEIGHSRSYSLNPAFHLADDLFGPFFQAQQFTYPAELSADIGKRGGLLELNHRKPQLLQPHHIEPFVPQAGTPMAGHHFQDTVKEQIIIAVMRMVLGDVLIPASLDVDGLDGLGARLNAGAPYPGRPRGTPRCFTT